MSMSCPSFRSECDSEYAVDGRGSFEKISRQDCRPRYRRSGTAPGSVNGMHRRRQSRWTWGHGRGARISNLRAVAGCLVAALMAVQAATVSAGTLVTVGNPGNAGKAIASGTFGAVAQSYKIGSSEVTNNEYVVFLNAAAKTNNDLGLYQSLMASNATGGITQSGTAGNFTYAVKSLTAGDQPVNFLSVYSAARYVNWLNNGSNASASESDINSGAYTLSNVANPGQALVRNANAAYFLPNRNEWYKAAYYSPTLSGTGGYYTYASSNNTVPTVSTNPAATGTNLGYYGQSNLSIPMIADGLANTQSPYGLVGMLGNVSEWLENSTSSQATWIGGWFNMSAGSVNTFASSSFAGSLQNSTTTSGAQGFRIAAVPEPSTVALAGLGLAGLVGSQLVKRRKARRSASLAG